MSEIELNTREETRAMHKAIRAELKKGACRTMLLLWAFVRGFKYRRIERSHHFDPNTGEELNIPQTKWLKYTFETYLPGVENLEAKIHAWLDDPTGAIPVMPREKRPYVAPVAKTG